MDHKYDDEKIEHKDNDSDSDNDNIPDFDNRIEKGTGIPTKLGIYDQESKKFAEHKAVADNYWKSEDDKKKRK